MANGLLVASVHDFAHLIIPVGHRPATLSEATVVVLFGSARGLHYTVEGQERLNDQLSHLLCPFDRIPRA